MHLRINAVHRSTANSTTSTINGLRRARGVRVLRKHQVPLWERLGLVRTDTSINKKPEELGGTNILSERTFLSSTIAGPSPIASPTSAYWARL